MENNLTDDEKKVVRECIKAAYFGPFFPDWEIDLLTGFTKDEIKDIDEKIKEIDLENEEQESLINNIIVNLLWYPHGEKENWSKYISVSRDILLEMFNKMKNNKNGNSNNAAQDYFDNII